MNEIYMQRKETTYDSKIFLYDISKRISLLKIKTQTQYASDKIRSTFLRNFTFMIMNLEFTDRV